MKIALLTLSIIFISTGAHAQDGFYQGYCESKLQAQYRKQKDLYEQSLVSGQPITAPKMPDLSSCAPKKEEKNKSGVTGQACDGLSAKPYASYGCSYSCINRQWAEICGD